MAEKAAKPVKPVKRGARGRWVKGTPSPNPTGRPPESLVRLARMARKDARLQIYASTPDLIDQTLKLALKGDATALKACLDRILPTLKAVDTPVEVDLSGINTVKDAVDKIITDAAAGDISPDESNALIAAFASAARIAESDEIIKRLDALEAKLCGKD